MNWFKSQAKKKRKEKKKDYARLVYLKTAILQL